MFAASQSQARSQCSQAFFLNDSVNHWIQKTNRDHYQRGNEHSIETQCHHGLQRVAAPSPSVSTQWLASALAR
eukprot:477488-Alexandrium_andersonii.AAC.1